MKRRWIVLAGSACLLIAAAVAAPEAVYRHALAKLNALPEPPPTDHLSETLAQVAWMEFEGPGPITVQRTGPIRLVTALALGRQPNFRGRNGVAPGFRLAAFCARSVIQDQAGETHGAGAFNLGVAALAIWLGRNWSTEEIVACALNRGYYGQGRTGIETAASGYFGRSAADLAHDEVALLMVVLRAPSQFEPHCDPVALKGDISELLARLQLEAASGIPARSITRRLSEGVWFSGRIRCVEPDDIAASG